jgi:pyruvate dehydrogenase E2 component (dihydrolipoyllysine-residue acetyltransferase)
VARPIVMPSLGMYTAEGTLATWLRPDGASVTAGEPVAEVTTEKATYEIEAPADGRLHTAAAAGATLAVQGVLGYVLAPGEAPPAAGIGESGSEGEGEKREKGNDPHPNALPLTPAPALPLSRSPSPRPASPIARRLAAQHGLDLAGLTGSGPGGRIVEADVLAAVAGRATGAGAPSDGAARRIRQRIPLAGMRRTIAERLRGSLSTTVPVTLTREVEAEALVAARERLGRDLGTAIPYDALFIKLLAAGLRERPELNAVVEGDAILVLDEVHIGFAVAVPGGLVVPVVRDADARPLAAVAAAVRDLTARAQAGRLRPADIEDGTATITNLGAYGVDAFTPILNPPQSAILGIGRIRPAPALHEGQWTTRWVCVLSLTFDHRVADGAPAARLLDAVARLMSDAERLTTLAAGDGQG